LYSPLWLLFSPLLVFLIHPAVVAYFPPTTRAAATFRVIANGNLQTSSDKLFSYKIDYHEDGRYFDGSISKQTWKAQNSPKIGAICIPTTVQIA
jgi:hypothetical protein